MKAAGRILQAAQLAVAEDAPFKPVTPWDHVWESWRLTPRAIQLIRMKAKRRRRNKLARIARRRNRK